MEIENLQPKKKSKHRDKNPFAPQWPFRVYMIGVTGSGKTNVLMNMLRKYLEYDTITIYAKEFDNDEKYIEFREMVEEIEEELEQALSYFSTELGDKFIPLEEYCKDNQNIIVFDDFAADERKEHKPVVETFIRGRHHNVSSFYLSQNLHALPKSARMQCSMIIVFKGCNDDDKRTLWKDHCSNVKWDEFDRLFHECTDPEHGFMVIDLKNHLLRIRKGFDQIYVPQKQ